LDIRLEIAITIVTMTIEGPFFKQIAKTKKKTTISTDETC
jgi:hypothetical protein